MKTLYQQSFRLDEAPFSIAPDPRFLYFSRQHKEALAHLKFGIESAGGFVLLTGEVGTGKTTLCRQLLTQLGEQTAIAFIINPMLTPLELVQTICEELGVTPKEANGAQPSGAKPWVDALNIYLLEAHRQGKNAIVMIDEAQRLSVEALEQVRLLTNLETNQEKLLRIVLLGQPELAYTLQQSHLTQLAQRITVRYHLKGLATDEVEDYLHHRFRVAGGSEMLPFTPGAIRALAKCAQNIPRKLNVIADRALLAAFADSQYHVTRRIVQRASQDVQGSKSGWWWWRWGKLVMATALAVGLGLGTLTWVWRAEVGEDGGGEALSVGTRITQFFTGRDRLAYYANSYIDAFTLLFEQWQAFPVTQQAPCSLAANYGLECLRLQGDWSTLLEINRPALLSIHLPNSAETVWLTVTSGDRLRFSVRNADSKQTLEVSALQELWNGEFLILWQLPPRYQTPVSEGTEGEIVLWLRDQLASLGYDVQAEDRPDYFDAQLVRQLKLFQTDRGLNSDGIAGPRTLIAINTATGLGIAKLSGTG